MPGPIIIYPVEGHHISLPPQASGSDGMKTIAIFTIARAFQGEIGLVGIGCRKVSQQVKNRRVQGLLANYFLLPF